MSLTVSVDVKHYVYIILLIVDRYMVGVAPALRFLWSQVLCRLYKSLSDNTVNPSPSCVYTCKKITYAKDPVVHVRVWWIMETSKLHSMHW